MRKRIVAELKKLPIEVVGLAPMQYYLTSYSCEQIADIFEVERERASERKQSRKKVAK